MDFQALLQREASSRGLTLTTISSVTAMPSSQKVICCGGLVEKIVAESAQDCTVLLRDVTGTIHCAIHGALSGRYPDALSAGALLLLRDVTVLVTPTLMPPVLVVCLEHLAALLLPEGPPENRRNLGTGYAAVPPSSSSSSLPLAELMMQRRETPCDVHGAMPSYYGCIDEDALEACLGSETAVAAAAVVPHTDLICPVRLDDDNEIEAEDCLQLADDL